MTEMDSSRITLAHLAHYKRQKRASFSVPAAKEALIAGPPHRLVTWTSAARYRALGPGTRSFASKENIVETHAQGQLHAERDFWEFVHKDEKIGRASDKLEPKYVALFRLQDGSFVVPQIKHYEQAYRNAGRISSTRALSVLPSGRPYWCCLHAIRAINGQKSKRKYRHQHGRGAAS